MTVVPAGPDTIDVTVTLFADLRRYLPRGVDGPQRFVLPAGATVADLLARIGIPPGTELTAGVDGEVAALDSPLPPRAQVMLLSPMEGGAEPPGEATVMKDPGERSEPAADLPSAVASPGERSKPDAAHPSALDLNAIDAHGKRTEHASVDLSAVDQAI